MRRPKITYRTRRPLAKRPKLKVQRTRKGSLSVTRIGLGEQPDRTVKMTAGDEVNIQSAGLGLPEHYRALDPHSRAIVMVAETQAERYEIYGQVAQAPAQNPTHMALEGPGLYWAQFRQWGWPFRRWLEEIAGGGMNYARVIMPARSWTVGYDAPVSESMFDRMPNGLYELRALNLEFLERFPCDLLYARQLGVVVHIDIADWHLFRWMPHFWNSEYYGVNNTLGYPLPEHNVKNWGNTYEHPMKRAYDWPEGDPRRELQEKFRSALLSSYSRFVNFIPAGHIVGDCNESESRAVSLEILRAAGRYPVTACGVTALEEPSGYDFLGDPQYQEIFDRITYICLHGIDHDTAPLKWDYLRLKGILGKYDHIRVLFSTDGAGAKQYRGQNGRPTYEQCLRARDLCRELAGERYGGFGDIKILGYNPQEGRADALGLFNYWRRYAK